MRRRRLIPLPLLLLLQFFTLSSAVVRAENADDTSFTGSGGSDLVLVSTIDGRLQAVEASTGTARWTLHEKPVLRAPTAVKQGFTFLPNPQDGTLYALRNGRLSRLPFSITQLVQASPCKSSDGIFYAGTKKDVWFGIDPLTGAKLETMSHTTAHRVCPVSPEPNGRAVYIGRSEYRLSMYDAENRTNQWNSTFVDYSAHLLSADTHWPLRHLASSSDGRLATLDATTGEMLWQKDFGLPVVALYLLRSDGLHRLPYTVLGKETIDTLLERWLDAMLGGGSSSSTGRSAPAIGGGGSTIGAGPAAAAPAANLFTSLYVGETVYGLYAITAYVDEHTVTIAPHYLGPPLLEGPIATASGNSQDAGRQPRRTKISLDSFDAAAAATHKTVDGEYVVLGYHEPPPLHPLVMTQSRMGATSGAPVYSPISMLDDKSSKGGRKPRIGGSSSMIDDEPPTTMELLKTLADRHQAALFATSSILGAVILTLIWRLLYSHPHNLHNNNNFSASAQTSRVSSHSTSGHHSGGTDGIPDGWIACGRVCYNADEVLGRGCEGTVVFRGRFDGREVAVKRVVTQFVRLVDREVGLLRSADTHPNVVRYFCMEADSHFRYVALELCSATLADYIADSKIRGIVTAAGLQPLEILRQATAGLAHLHSLNIVHRDMKPQNVLLSTANRRGEMRAVISDFGLCKEIRDGRASLSQRSGAVGGAGTFGWMAPELLTAGKSISFPVDVFSLGCIFYYVLTGGSHPFGDSLSCQHNIVSGDSRLDGLDKRQHALERFIIERMIRSEPSRRPSTARIVLHPVFWSAQRTLQFFSDVSDRIEKEDMMSSVVARLERASIEVFGPVGWRRKICTQLQDDLRKHRTYKANSVRDLLRAMRNKKHHYRELDEEVRKALGALPDEFTAYFTTRFPMLLPLAYRAMVCCAAEPVFRDYYADEDRVYAETLEQPTYENIPSTPQNWRQQQQPNATESTCPDSAVNHAISHSRATNGVQQQQQQQQQQQKSPKVIPRPPPPPQGGNLTRRPTPPTLTAATANRFETLPEEEA